MNTVEIAPIVTAVRHEGGKRWRTDEKEEENELK